MNIRHPLLAIAGLLTLGGGYALTQTIVQQTLSGNECWNAGQGPGGPSTGFVCSSSLRNGSNISLYSGSGAFTTTANALQSTLYWVGTAPTTWTITTPAYPFDGQTLTIGTDTTLTTRVTLTANTGQTLDVAYTSQTLTASTSIEYQYVLTTATWYRRQ